MPPATERVGTGLGGSVGAGTGGRTGLVRNTSQPSVAENKLSEIEFYPTEKTEWKKLSISHFYKTVLNKVG